MDNSPFDHPLPWTGEEYLALGETLSRVDLIEGALWCGPRGHGVHQDVVGELLSAFRPAARAAGLRAYYHVNVRMAPDSIVGPDLVVTGAGGVTDVVDASEVILVGEVTSPGSALMDTTLRRNLYAKAGIPWYLLVELDFVTWESMTLRLLRLGCERYVKHVTAKMGEILLATEPFPIAIKPEELIAA